MKQEFEMEQQEMDDIISINKNQMPMLKIGDVNTGMDLRERINAYWSSLGNKYGFKYDTVEPSAKGKLFFLAEPCAPVVPKTQTEKEIDKYIGGISDNIPSSIRISIGKIVAQLEMSDYECEGGFLKNNIAFLALKKIAERE